MLPVFICENDPVWRKNLKRTIENFILLENLNMKVVLSTDDPLKVLEYLHKHPGQPGLYFLDIHLDHDMNGIALATEIRELDLLGHIVFVTVHIELTSTIFTLKIEALDFILKSKHFQDIKGRITSCIDTAYKRYLCSQNAENQQFQVNINGNIHIFPFHDVMFFESSPLRRHVILHLEQEQRQLYYSLRDAELYSSAFFRCHRSYVVNIQNITYLDREKLEIRMQNKEMCPASARGLKELKKILR
ncbi:MAG: LytTR family DNA-binding domain-containing protein [Lachnospiraceae bacterium]|nr:LytTR family DNA-binding domain-containing protein [Lachnospiraceae bacterium]